MGSRELGDRTSDRWKPARSRRQYLCRGDDGRVSGGSPNLRRLVRVDVMWSVWAGDDGDRHKMFRELLAGFVDPVDKGSVSIFRPQGGTGGWSTGPLQINPIVDQYTKNMEHADPLAIFADRTKVAAELNRYAYRIYMDAQHVRTASQQAPEGDYYLCVDVSFQTLIHEVAEE